MLPTITKPAFCSVPGTFRSQVVVLSAREGFTQVTLGTWGNPVKGFGAFTRDPSLSCMETFYDALGNETVSIAADTTDIDLPATGPNAAFYASRADNPRIVTERFFTEGLTRVTADIAAGVTKRTGSRHDGFGNVIEEIEYAPDMSVYSVKKMSYDSYGRLVCLTDADAERLIGAVTVNGVTVNRMDKSWIVKNDSLGRKVTVLYPDTGTGSGLKKFTYNDAENSVTVVSPEGRVETVQNDWSGNPVKITVSGGTAFQGDGTRTYSFTYDRLNRKTTFTDATGGVTRWSYDERNLVTEQVFTDGTKNSFTYDVRGLMATKTDARNAITRFEYDEAGRNVDSYLYRSSAELAANRPQMSVSMMYDVRGNLTRTDTGEIVEYYEYDRANRLSGTKRALKDESLHNRFLEAAGLASGSSFDFSYAYNSGGQLLSMEMPDSSHVAYSYDTSYARLSSIALSASGRAVNVLSSVGYTRSGQVTSLGYGNGTEQRWTFDNRKRIKKIEVSNRFGALLEDLEYSVSADGNILSINDNEYAYNAFGEVIFAKTLMSGKVDPLSAVRSSFGSTQGVDDSFDTRADLGSHPFVREGDGVIDGVDHQMASLVNTADAYDLEGFTYDEKGNRTALVQNGVRFVYEYGERNMLLRVWREEATGARLKVIEYEYDGNGNTVKKTVFSGEGVSQTFTYDLLNRVKSSVNASGEVTRYVYDAAGNRVVKSGEGESVLYLRHGAIAVAMEIAISGEGESEKVTVSRYALSGDLVAGELSTVRVGSGEAVTTAKFYHLDHVNSTKVVSDETGQIGARYEYRAFGSILSKTGEQAARYTYGGKELDEQTNLYYCNARYYDADIGRFISIDPAQDGYNWYVYCGNNPLSFVDPSGELAVAFAALGAAIGGLSSAVVSIQSGCNMQDTLINVGVGIAGGATAGLALSVGQSAVAGAIIGATSNYIVQKTTGDKEVDPKQVLVAGALGAASGALGTAAGGHVANSSIMTGMSATSAAEVGNLANAAVTGLTSTITGALTNLMDIDSN